MPQTICDEVTELSYCFVQFSKNNIKNQMYFIIFLEGQSFSRKLTMCFCVVPAVQYSNKDYEKGKRLVFLCMSYAVLKIFWTFYF